MNGIAIRIYPDEGIPRQGCSNSYPGIENNDLDLLFAWPILAAKLKDFRSGVFNNVAHNLTQRECDSVNQFTSIGLRQDLGESR